jgi:hypothetical protein
MGAPVGVPVGVIVGIQDTHQLAPHVTTKPSSGFPGLMIIDWFLQNPLPRHITMFGQGFSAIHCTGVMGDSHLWIAWWTLCVLLELGISVLSTSGN